MEKTKIKSAINTPVFRVSYPNVFEAKLNPMSNKMEYSIVMLFDKKTAKNDLKDLKALCQAIATEKWGAKIPANLRSPFRDGDIEKAENPSFKGMIFVTSKSKNMPGLVNQQKQEILSQDEFYGGCYARAHVNVYAYSKAGNNGISLGLQHIQKVKDGEPFGSKTRVEDAFAPIEDGEETELETPAAKGMFD